jgi:hypothetical protein
VFDFEIVSDGVRRAYRVRRERKRKNGTTKAFLYEYNGDKLEALAEGARDVDEAVEKIIGLTFADFKMCIALPQGDFAALVKSTPSDRVKLVSRLFNLEKYGEKLSKAINEKYAKAESEVDLLKAKMSENEGGRVENIEEAKQNARWQIGYVIALSLITVLIMICMIPFVQVMNDFQPETATLLAIIMIIHAVSLPFMFYSVNVIFITRSGGFTKAPFIITNLPYLFIKIPLVTLFVFIAPQLFENSPAIHTFLNAVGLPGNLVIFIFLIDRLIEIVRAVIAYFVMHKAHWLGNLSGHTKEAELIVETETPII